jgi:hypothetical protein
MGPGRILLARTGYLTKPFRMPQILDMVANAVRRRQ